MKSSENVIVVQRSGKEEGIIVCETAYETGSVYLDGEYQDVVTGDTVRGTLELPPYGYQVLRKVLNKNRKFLVKSDDKLVTLRIAITFSYKKNRTNRAIKCFVSEPGNEKILPNRQNSIDFSP